MHSQEVTTTIFFSTQVFESSMPIEPPKEIARRTLLSIAQLRRQDPRIAPAVKHSDDEKRLITRSVGDEEFPDDVKLQRPRSKVASAMTLLRESDECVKRGFDFLENSIRIVRVVGGDEFPNLHQIRDCVRVKNKPAHRRRRSSLFLRSSVSASSPSTAFT